MLFNIDPTEDIFLIKSEYYYLNLLSKPVTNLLKHTFSSSLISLVIKCCFLCEKLKYLAELLAMMVNQKCS